jgi:hypothetical protein
MHSSRVPPPDTWDEVERDHLKSFRCTRDSLPWQLCCGRPAVAVTRWGRDRGVWITLSLSRTKRQAEARRRRLAEATAYYSVRTKRS